MKNTKTATTAANPPAMLALARQLIRHVDRLSGYAHEVATGGDLLHDDTGTGSPMRVKTIRPRERFDPAADHVLVFRRSTSEPAPTLNADVEPFLSERIDTSRVAAALRNEILAVRTRFIAAGPPVSLIRTLDALDADASEAVDLGLGAVMLATTVWNRLCALHMHMRDLVAECAKYTDWMEGWAVAVKSTKPNRSSVRGKHRQSLSAKPPTAKQLEAIQIVGECQGSIADAARRLGVSRKTLDQHYKAGLAKAGTAMTRRKLSTVQLTDTKTLGGKDRGSLPSRAARADPCGHHYRNDGDRN